MSWKVCAWRGRNGHVSINVGTRIAAGWGNFVAEFSLSSEEELEQLIAECRAAWQRAADATEPLYEEMPGPYDGWEWDAH